MKRSIEVLAVPFGLGAGIQGSEHGPAALLQAGLLERLYAAGHLAEVRIVEGSAKLSGEKEHGLELLPGMKYGAEVLAANKRLAEEVAAALRGGKFPLVLGGDHSLAIGSLAGLTAKFRKPGVIWLDAHADLNTERTSPSGNMHGIPLAVGLHQCRLKLADIRTGAVPLQAGRIVLVAARDVDPGELELIRKANICWFTMEDIRRKGIDWVMAEALRVAGKGSDGIHLSFDIDSLDPSEAPGTGTKVAGGLSARQVLAAFGVLRRSGKLTSMDAVEVNPGLDRKRGQTVRLAAKLIASVFGG